MPTRRTKKEPVKKDTVPPRALKIGYQDFALLFEDASHDNRTHFGLTNLLKSSIHVVRTGNKVEDINTLIHEILHACVYTQGIKLSHDEEELVVNSLSNGLVGVIRENPLLIEYILDQLGMLKE
jgi:Zn-dependent peptidase ImmA (M78 family)